MGEEKRRDGATWGYPSNRGELGEPHVAVRARRDVARCGAGGELGDGRRSACMTRRDDDGENPCGDPEYCTAHPLPPSPDWRAWTPPDTRHDSSSRQNARMV